MAAGVKIQYKRKAGAFIAGELAAGEMGVDTTNGTVYFSADGSTVNKILSSSSVPLGRWSGTNAGSAPLDNIFDDAIYSHYTIVGQFLPVTNGANLLAVLRTATPADVSGGILVGGAFGRLDAAGSGTEGAVDKVATAVSSASGKGVSGFKMTLIMSSGYRHFFESVVIYQHTSGARYSLIYPGEFVDTTPRQGIKFAFSSGNMTGWYEVIGHKKQ